MTTPRPDAVSRRAMLGTLARWTVPTVATMTLGARILEAKSSCPPCQRKSGTVCRACTVSQMLNCQCEPCLGPPYCAAVGPSAPIQPSAAIRAPGSQGPGPSAPSGTQNSNGGAVYGQRYLDLQREQLRQSRDPFRQQLYPDPFGLNKDQPNGTGLYQRLHPDSTRRLP